MRKLIILSLFFAVASLGCTQTSSQEKTSGNQPLMVTVYYFHGAYRCPTCKAIEANAKATVEKHFSAELLNGKVKFITVDVSQEANLQLAEKYQASGSALWVTRMADGKETMNDMTAFAFGSVKSDPAKFETGLKDKIAACLKP